MKCVPQDCFSVLPSISPICTVQPKWTLECKHVLFLAWQISVNLTIEMLFTSQTRVTKFVLERRPNSLDFPRYFLPYSIFFPQMGTVQCAVRQHAFVFQAVLLVPNFQFDFIGLFCVWVQGLDISVNMFINAFELSETLQNYTILIWLVFMSFYLGFVVARSSNVWNK